MTQAGSAQCLYGAVMDHTDTLEGFGIPHSPQRLMGMAAKGERAHIGYASNVDSRRRMSTDVRVVRSKQHTPEHVGEVASNM